MKRCLLMRFAEGRGGVVHPVLLGAGAIACGIFLALLTSPGEAYAAAPAHTHHTPATHASDHPSTHPSAPATAAPAAPHHLTTLATRDPSNATQDPSNSHATRRDRSLGRRDNASGVGLSATTRADAGVQGSAQRLLRAGADARAAREHPHATPPRPRPQRQPGALSNSHAPVTSLPGSTAPVLPSKSPPAAPNDDPSGPLPAPDALSLQPSPSATTFAPNVPFAFFGLLALLLGAWHLRGRVAPQPLSGLALVVPWPPG